MTLTGEDIQAAGLIIDSSPAGYRATSYDVSIGTIVKADGSTVDSYVLPQQGIVQVVSRERIQLPPEVTGTATVRTSLCNEGVLALSIGVIDPGYHGPVSSFLVNFGNEPRLLTTGESFLRLQFVRLSSPAPLAARPLNDFNVYLADRRRQATKTGVTFLNLDKIIEGATKKLFTEWRNGAFLYVGSFALFLALITFMLNFGTFQLVKGWLQPIDTVRADFLRSALTEENGRLAKANDELAARVAALEAASRATRPSAPISAPPGVHQ